MLAEILAYNKSALGRSASLAFSFLLSKLGTICQWKAYERGSFLSKMVYKRVRGWTAGRSLPTKTLLGNSPGEERAGSVLVSVCKVGISLGVFRMKRQNHSVDRYRVRLCLKKWRSRSEQFLSYEIHHSSCLTVCIRMVS